ncbi:MAG: glucosidase [Flavisolibacter sp.]
MAAELERLLKNENKAVPLVQWGPYLSERQWGTVREDYSDYGDAWQYFPYDQAHCRSYLWGEDGIAGISDLFQNLCFSIALWNGKDKILKERLFGLRNGEGNHGEDVKELYYYLDNLPTHYLMEYLYKYPQNEFPYQQLREENKRRSTKEAEYEILDTGVFDRNEYFDILITYAKQSDNDIFIRITVTNRYNKTAEITVLPTLFFHNEKAKSTSGNEASILYINKTSVVANHERLGNYFFYFQNPIDSLFTNNSTNTFKVTGVENEDIFVKDAFHDAIIQGQNLKSLRNKKSGTKFSPVYKLKIPGGASRNIYCRLSDLELDDAFSAGFQDIFHLRKKEADEFYAAILPNDLSDDMARIQRQALAGLLWSKQFYYFDVEKWLSTSDGISPLSDNKKHGRNHEWGHLKNQDIILMPDKWEYPWYAAWDLAFQCISMSVIDPTFAKHQMLLIMREWYMHPNGQLPAYEWNFSDVNPPVHAWAAFQVYSIEKKRKGKGDVVFLKKIFHKLLINFTWWINRKDRKGNNIFEGGFLGLDNIGVFNRSFHGGEMQLEQADGTSWMGCYALNMMDIAIEIALHDASFEDTATKFFEHFVLIAEALNQHHLWNEEDKFFYDVLSVPGAEPKPLQIKSIVGPNEEGDGEAVLVSLVPKERLIYLLDRLLDEEEFLSPAGIRALSKYHELNPYSVLVNGHNYTISYDPGDSTSDIFGGNSNWRGPVWMPINFLIIQSIRKYGKFYGDTLLVDYPSRSGNKINLCEVANQLTEKIINLFVTDEMGNRRFYDSYNWFYEQKGNEHLVLFYEYFHGDSGKGLGASHQTGWTALVAELISEYGQYKKEKARTALAL